MCTWCAAYGYWECDGEGGDCQGPGGGGHGDEPCVQVPHGGGWTINCKRPLRYNNANPVPDPRDPLDSVTVHIVAQVNPNGLMVKLNGKTVTPMDNDGEQPPLPDYKDGRPERTWAVNIPFQLPWPAVDNDDDKPDFEIPVRVQAYAYDYDSKYHPNPNHPTSGSGPKIRVYAGEEPK